MNRKVLTVEERFWSHVDKDGPVPSWRPDLGNCWLWTGRLDDGYGRFWNGSSPNRKLISAHHFLVGSAGEGLDWDHLCRNRACVRPSHLEAVTRQVNLRRGHAAIRLLKTGSDRVPLVVALGVQLPAHAGGVGICVACGARLSGDILPDRRRRYCSKECQNSVHRAVRDQRRRDEDLRNGIIAARGDATWLDADRLVALAGRES